MSKLEVDAIEPQSGTTLTLGASGDTITIPSGANLSSTDPLVFPAGTASSPAVTTTGDTNTGIFFPAADTIGFAEGGAEAMRINSSGNVGIGTTSPGAKLEISASTPDIQLTDSDGTNQFAIIKQDGSNLKILSRNDTGSGGILLKRDVGGTETDAFQIQAGGDISFYDSTGASQALFWDASTSRLGIGTTTPSDKLDVNGKILSTSLDVSGTLRATKDSTAFDIAGYHQILGSTTSYYTLKILNKASSPSVEYITEVSFASGSPDSSGAKFFQMRDSTTARVNINSDGDLQNHDNSYGAISDERIKQNIVDAGSQWEDIKNIRVRKYKKKDDVLQYGEANAPIELGVISQELETVSPGLIKEDKPDISHVNMHPDFTGDNPQNVKYVKYSILYMKAIKALQEAMERIETLEAKVTQLENK